MSTIMPIILIVASVGMFLGYINPTYTGSTGSIDINQKSIKELQTEKADYTDALNRTHEIELARSNLLSKLNSLSDSDKEKIERALPDNIDSVRLIIDIDNIASKYGMSLSKIVLKASGDVPKKQSTAPIDPEQQESLALQSVGPSSSTYSSIQLGFSVIGTYDDFIAFLKELEGSLRIVDVTSLSFNTGRSTAVGSASQSPATSALLDASGMYVYNVTIRTYYLK